MEFLRCVPSYNPLAVTGLYPAHELQKRILFHTSAIYQLNKDFVSRLFGTQRVFLLFFAPQRKAKCPFACRVVGPLLGKTEADRNRTVRARDGGSG